MSTPNERIVVTIATPLEPELVARIAAVDDRLEVRYEGTLLPPTRFLGDHRVVDGFQRTPEQEVRWRRVLARVEVVFGLPRDRHPAPCRLAEQ